MSIRENWKRFGDDLESAALRYNRDPAEIAVMAVSKNRTVEEVIEARSAGLRLFGENRVDEAAVKFENLDSDEYPLCLIGHLQSNKTAKIDARFRGVHSVDSVRIAARLSRIRSESGIPLEVLLQVNTSGEESKSGFDDPVQFAEAAQEISRMPFLVLNGVMTMAPFVEDEHIVRSCFARCRRWSESLAGLVSGETIISMGMSSDFGWAVAEGSNLLRIGTVIFGDRI